MVTSLQTVCRMLNRVPTLGSVHSSVMILYLALLFLTKTTTRGEGGSFKRFKKGMMNLFAGAAGVHVPYTTHRVS